MSPLLYFTPTPLFRPTHGKCCGSARIQNTDPLGIKHRSPAHGQLLLLLLLVYNKATQTHLSRACGVGGWVRFVTFGQGKVFQSRVLLANSSPSKKGMALDLSQVAATGANVPSVATRSLFFFSPNTGEKRFAGWTFWVLPVTLFRGRRCLPIRNLRSMPAGRRSLAAWLAHESLHLL